MDPRHGHATFIGFTDEQLKREDVQGYLQGQGLGDLARLAQLVRTVNEKSTVSCAGLAFRFGGEVGTQADFVNSANRVSFTAMDSQANGRFGWEWTLLEELTHNHSPGGPTVAYQAGGDGYFDPQERMAQVQEWRKAINAQMGPFTKFNEFLGNIVGHPREVEIVAAIRSGDYEGAKKAIEERSVSSEVLERDDLDDDLIADLKVKQAEMMQWDSEPLDPEGLEYIRAWLDATDGKIPISQLRDTMVELSQGLDLESIDVYKDKGTASHAAEGYTKLQVAMLVFPHMKPLFEVVIPDFVATHERDMQAMMQDMQANGHRRDAPRVEVSRSLNEYIPDSQALVRVEVDGEKQYFYVASDAMGQKLADVFGAQNIEKDLQNIDAFLMLNEAEGIAAVERSCEFLKEHQLTFDERAFNRLQHGVVSFDIPEDVHPGATPATDDRSSFEPSSEYAQMSTRDAIKSLREAIKGFLHSGLEGEELSEAVKRAVTEFIQAKGQESDVTPKRIKGALAPRNITPVAGDLREYAAGQAMKQLDAALINDAEAILFPNDPPGQLLGFMGDNNPAARMHPEAVQALDQFFLRNLEGQDKAVYRAERSEVIDLNLMQSEAYQKLDAVKAAVQEAVQAM